MVRGFGGESATAMKIIILGAGQVGRALAETLANEQNDITLVDNQAEKLRLVQDRLDIRSVTGYASHPDTLFQAGADDADMMVAVTGTDEINMMACQVGHALFQTPTKIARVRSLNYLSRQELFCDENVPIDVLINPEQLVTESIEELIANPGASQVLNFAGGLVQMVAVRALPGSPAVGRELREIPTLKPRVDTRVAAIFRRDQSIIPTASTVIEVGDELFFIAARKNIRKVLSKLRRLDRPYRKIFIAGGGNVGTRLATALDQHYDVKLLERSYSRCKELSEQLENALVLNGSANDADLLEQEEIDKADVFCALTNDDEANLMIAMLAKKLGAGKVVTAITNLGYADLLPGGQIDVALSPEQLTIGTVLAHVRQGQISRVHSLRRGAVEAIEVTALGDADSSAVVGRRLDQIDLPEGATIAALVRGDEILMAHRHLVVESEDHVILLLVDKTRVRAVEKMFQAGFNYF